MAREEGSKYVSKYVRKRVSTYEDVVMSTYVRLLRYSASLYHAQWRPAPCNCEPSLHRACNVPTSRLQRACNVPYSYTPCISATYPCNVPYDHI